MRKTIYSRQHDVLLSLLLEARKGSAITQVELAHLLGVTQSEVSKVERGERLLDVLQLRAWVNALGLPISVFVEVLDERLDTHKSLDGLGRLLLGSSS